jgi:hypothetical protein
MLWDFLPPCRRAGFGRSAATAVAYEFAFEARVKVDKPMVIGESSHGLRRIVPILGGPVQGPALKGNVIAGGADWQYLRSDGAWELEARYTVQTDGCVLIMVENRGVRYGKPEVMERLAKGKRWTPTRSTAARQPPLKRRAAASTSG